MLTALYNYFYSLFGGSFCDNIDVSFDLSDGYGNQYLTDLGDYLSIICSLISLIFIVVLCCLFIWKLIKLVGRLFSGGAL